MRRVGSWRSPRPLWLLLLALSLGVAPACAQPRGEEAAAAPGEDSFAATVARLSEPGGYFDTDNLISNEGSYLHVMGTLAELGVEGGAYLGVGPDQNFSYIARVRPSVALLVDIRRDNLLEHLLFKALFDLSTDRMGYLGLLLGRPVPELRDPAQPVEEIVEYLDRTPMSEDRFEQDHRAVVARIQGYGVPLRPEEWETVRRFHRTFAGRGMDLQFESFGRTPRSDYPNLRELVLERDLDGRRASYLASDEAFQVVRTLQSRDLVIPVVGDLAGTRALPAIADFLRERGERVSVYYVSNADYYIAGDGKLDRFLANLKALPRDERSVIIRSVFRAPGGMSPPPAAGTRYRSVQRLQRIDSLVREYDEGRVRGYRDLITVGSLGPG